VPSLTRGLIVHAVVGYAAFTLVVVGARLVGLSFSSVVVVGSLIWGAVALSGALRLWRNRRAWTRREALPLALLMTLAVVTGALACAINAPEEDDSFYIPASVYSLAHPDRPMTFDLEWIVPFPSGAKLSSDLGLVSNNAEVLWASVSHLTDRPLLALYHVGGALLFGAAFPLVYFWLLSRFLPKTSSALVGTLLVTIAAFLLFREGGLGFGITMNKIWIGKAILMTVMIPVVAGFAFEFGAGPNPTRWGLLAASIIAATGFSSSSLFLIPSLLLALTPGHVMLSLSNQALAPERRWLVAAALPAAAAYPVAFGAFFYFKYRERILNVKEVAFSSNLEIFNSGFTPYFGTWTSVTSVAVLVSFAYLLYRRQRAHVPLLCWFAAGAVFFTNPLVSGVVARHLTSILVYGRIFYVLPVFAVVGVAAGDVAGRLTGRFKTALLAVSMLEAAGLFALHVDPRRLQLDVPKAPVLGGPHFGPPFMRMDPDLMQDVRDIEQTLPDGNTLSTVDYQLAISMLTTKLPQYDLAPIDIITFYGERLGQAEDARLRYGAARFLLGQGEQFRGDLEALLDTRVRNVIVSKRLAKNVTGIKRAVAGKGFTLVKETRRYALYSRPASQ
jgi:hypothetical protein